MLASSRPRFTAESRPSDEIASALLTKQQFEILRHAIGADEFGRRRADRNHFVTGVGSTDHPTCVSLVELGLMTCRERFALAGGDDVFFVTDAGIDALRAHAKTPPRLTRSQLRYREWLESDSTWSFEEWLKHRFGRYA